MLVFYLIGADIGLPLVKDQKRAKSSHGGILASQTALSTLIAKEDHVQTFRLVIRTHR